MNLTVHDVTDTDIVEGVGPFVGNFDFVSDKPLFAREPFDGGIDLNAEAFIGDVEIQILAWVTEEAAGNYLA